MIRRPVIAGNWKMHHGPAETRDFFHGLEAGASDAHTLLIFPPALSFAAAMYARPEHVKLGVQNVHFEEKGAFTGEVSVGMAREAGADFVLIGHSERRHVFGETDDEVRRKVEAVCAAGLVPVICVGETLEQRQAGELEAVLDRQIDAAVAGLSDGSDFLIAYEPVWAIGTGETATPADASSAHAHIRARLRSVLPSVDADEVPILYGGSVKPANAAELLAAADVDGVLVGGASLDPASFSAIAAAVS